MMMLLLCLALFIPLCLPFSPRPSISVISTTSTPLKKDDYVSPLHAQSRRDILLGGSVITGQLLVNSRVATAADESSVLSQFINPQAASSELETGLLESRVVSNVLNPPPYGMEGPDIFYPSWFLPGGDKSGTWRVKSKTLDVQAPCGVALFGGNMTYANALKDIGNSLDYDSRFITDSSGRCIADREFNVKAIAKVAMGENSVVDVSSASPNKFSCVLAPQGSPSMLTVDLIALNRRQELVSANRFDCSEVVREIASPVDGPRRQPAILKEIETTSLYTYIPDKDEMHCKQRSAAFLLPSNDSPIGMKMWQASRGRAIDCRFYDVTYTRK